MDPLKRLTLLLIALAAGVWSFVGLLLAYILLA